MPLHIVRNDITKMEADAIVNTANPLPVIGSGTDMAVYEAAGMERLLKKRKKIGEIRPGCSALTPAYGLAAKYIIHTVSPVWQGGGCGEAECLAECYRSALELARKKHCRSIVFPLLASGSNGFPKDLALQTALKELQTFLLEHEMEIYLAVFDRSSFELSGKLFADVRSYIEEHQVEQSLHNEYRQKNVSRREDRPALSGYFREDPENMREEADLIPPVMHSARPSFRRPAAAAKEEALPAAVRLPQKEETFQVRLLELIDRSGRTDPDVYKHANLDRKLFAKIRKDENYKPSRKTAVALALALHLSEKETEDLLARAGIALSRSTTFDLIIRYCLENRLYNIFDVNAILFEFDQETL